MEYSSTRDSVRRQYCSSEVLIKGLADDGGLFVPVDFPAVTFSGRENYIDMATAIFRQFLTDFADNDIQTIVNQTYRDFNPSVLHKINDTLIFLELWHGKTSAFKDVALQLLPRLLTQALKNSHEDAEVVILVATSGDTGKAALEGFANVPQTKIAVFYPQDGVSDTQKQQMVTQEGDNVAVFAIKGNFDDAQTAVKKILNDSDYLKSNSNVIFSSANSINWGRLMPQLVYYFSSYFSVANGDEKVSFIVPTGNFGDILAGYYAKKMGLPVDKLICASNKNNVLTDFIQTGVYSVKRDFYKTISPSMDILVSSNLERLLFDVYDGDANAISGLMNDLKETGQFKIGQSQLEKIQETFIADFATEEETKQAIQTAYEQYHYLIDTHTAVAFAVYEKHPLENKTVILSTASPYKFPQNVYQAIFKEDTTDYATALYEKTGVEIPKNIKELQNKKVIHTKVIEKGMIKNALNDFLIRR
ncbi:MAG: threonine synthase [Candidatus Symbiothrix sp.]|jgi:threonine synthase|nr:threonine synthase [Candidatus Symbiothrix sp.]